MLKPSRSDEILSPEEQLNISHETRRHFEDANPRRPFKPSRSESSNVNDEMPVRHSDQIIPEHEKFLQLEACQDHLVDEPAVVRLPEEFIETEYYDEFNKIDKTLHHMTGAGFINIQETVKPPTNVDTVHPNKVVRSGSHGNLSTNDWIPSSSQHLVDESTVVGLPEEFIETEYYDEFNKIDKTLHHTTGTGFIRVQETVIPATIVDTVHPNKVVRSDNHGNPSTNDWIPSPSQISSFIDRHKPGRSEQ